jgi:hypothetical protein
MINKSVHQQNSSMDYGAQLTVPNKPQSPILLTGISTTDIDILAFYKARSNILKLKPPLC